MKVAIVSLYSRIGDVTGDCVQANKTAIALRSAGHDVVRCYLRPEDGFVYDENALKMGRYETVLADREIVHAMIPSWVLRKLPRVNAKLACYTVFWKSLKSTLVTIRNNGKIRWPDIKDVARTALSLIGIRTYSFYKDYDLLLPNSEDETRCVKRYCEIPRNAQVITIPNAIDALPSSIDEIARIASLPKEDYIVVPAYFAARKNQIGLLDAIWDLKYPIVFMGEGPLLEKCRSKASSDCVFLGHVKHGTVEFWSALRHARVVCLPSNCETPGIAGLEAAAVGARPVVPYEGGTAQYYGWCAEYHDPISRLSLRNSIIRAWQRGRLSAEDQSMFRRLTWDVCAEKLIAAYSEVQ